MLLIGLTLVSLDHGAFNFVTLGSKELIQVQVIVIGWQVANVQTGLLWFISVVSILIAAIVSLTLVLTDLHKC